MKNMKEIKKERKKERTQISEENNYRIKKMKDLRN